MKIRGSAWMGISVSCVMFIVYGKEEGERQIEII